MRDVAKPVGIIKIRLINRKSGEEKAIQLVNDILSGYAGGVVGELCGEGVRLGKIDAVHLYDSADSLIKSLSPPSTLEHLTASGQDKAHAVWEDNSSDEYTVAKIYISTLYDSSVRTIAGKAGLNVTKTSSDKLVVDYTLTVPYTTV